MYTAGRHSSSGYNVIQAEYWKHSWAYSGSDMTTEQMHMQGIAQPSILLTQSLVHVAAAIHAADTCNITCNKLKSW